MATPHGYTELRLDIPDELARRIDAMMMIKKLKSRAEFVVPLLTESTDAAIHDATVLLRIVGINPLDSSSNGRGKP